MQWFFTKLKKPHPQPFWPTDFKTLFSSKKSFDWILNFYITVTLCKKSEKFHPMTFDNPWKASLRAHFGLLLTQKPLNKIFFPITIYWVSLKATWYCNFMQRIRKIPRAVHKIWKTTFWPYFGPFWCKNTRTWFFSKNQTPSLCKLDNTLTSCKKSEKFYERFHRKTPDKWTNVSHRTFTWSKKSGPSFFKLDDTLTSFKKFKKFSRMVSEKNSGQTDKLKESTS